MTGYCGRDFDYYGIQWLEINRDLIITWTDTILSFTLDSMNIEIIDTQIVEIVKRDYHITKEGKINDL